MKKTNSNILIIYSKNIFIFAFFAVFFGVVISKDIYGVALYSAIFLVFYSVFMLVLQKAVYLKEAGFLVLIVILSLVAKLFSVFYFEQLLIINNSMPFLSYNDDYNYEITSSLIKMAWENKGIGFYKDIKFGTGFYSGYPNFSAAAKYIFGDSYLVPRFMNVFFSCLTIPFFYFTCKKLTNNKLNIRFATILLSLSLAFITYSSLQLKDTVLVFFVSTLIYGTAHYYHAGSTVMNTLIVAISMVVLVFFRAAIILPYVVSLSMTFIFSKNESGKSLVWMLLLFLFFYIGWEYLHSTGLLAMTGEEYFESRFLLRAEHNQFQGSNNINKLGLIAVLMAPILTLFSLFLPSPIFVELDSYTELINYHYLPAIGYYGIAPMLAVCVVYMLKNYRVSKLGFFLICFLLLYKIGQAGSKSILDTRQSLPSIYIAYIVVSLFDLNNSDIYKLWVRYRYLILLVMLVVMFAVTFLRYYIRA